MQIKTEGLVIMEKTVGESDRLVTVLTKSDGLVHAFVKGAKSLKNKNSISTQLFCYSRLVIYKGREKYIIDEATPIEVFFSPFPFMEMHRKARACSIFLRTYHSLSFRALSS